MALEQKKKSDLRAEVNAICQLPDGVDMFGVAPMERFMDLPEKNRPSAFLPGTKSVIVLGSQLFEALAKKLSTQRKVGEVSFRNLFDHHNAMVNQDVYQTSYRVARFLTNQGFTSLHLGQGLTDNRDIKSAFRFKNAAYQAGLGVPGKNGLLLTPAYGPRFKLGVVLTEAIVEPDEVMNRDLCGDCDICIKVCPTGALAEPGEDGLPVHDRFKCSAFQTANQGCGMCMAKCPR